MINRLLILFVFLFAFLFSHEIAAQKRKSKGTSANQSAHQYDPGVFQGIKLRNLTPGRTGGRIVDIAVDPNNKSIKYAAAASGNVWKTENAGTTWKPIFDNYGSFSTGVIEIDPNNSNVLWLGTGENNAQRSVGMGDGVYKSVNGGRSWKNMGLKSSEHIGKIVINPHNSDEVYVAAQGPLWAPGGERGLYKTIDGGQTWERVLYISENTGISDIVMDPRDPNVLYATSYQRRRHFGILVAGGPEGAAYKSIDGGKNWKKIKGGFPSGDLGRIGLAISPIDPDVLYAIVAGKDHNKGFYRSENRGGNWTRMSDYMVVDAQYYMEIFPDPNKFDRVYVVDVFIHVSEDGGRTFNRINESRKHVDSHEIVFDKDDPNYIMVGCDGGIYESWDRAKTWKFHDNIPITQFYRVGIDNAKPFYNVYGGTQDNNTIGGPSRTIYRTGIRNADWFYTLGGDGFQVRIDPTDPNIVYCMYQYAGIIRYDKKSGEQLDIQPQPEKGEPPLKWNWDSPLIISPHNHKRLYFAANKLFRSDDRGNTWKPVSDDLTRKLDRNKMEVMGQVWGIDAIFKNVWTSPLGTIVSLSESTLQEDLLYVGTDDGIIQVTEDGGNNWRKIDQFPGVPKLAYVADVFASKHDVNTVYAVFNNHKYGDYKPYFLKSTDKGRTWTSINGNLPSRDFGWTIVQDHVNKDLLFAGTEYGLYFTLDAGKQWMKFSNGVPTMAFRDLEIQERENDLVAASFGRGFYILDNYDPLRHISTEVLARDTKLFPVKDAPLYLQSGPDGYSYGHNFYSSPNPTYGAIFTYYVKEGSKTRRQKRGEKEKELRKKGQPVPYPDWKDFTDENRERAPKIIFTITDESGEVVRRINGSSGKGIHRVSWNLRYGGEGPVRDGNNPSGPLVAPGTYTVSMAQVVDGQWTDLEESQTFEVVPLNNTTLPATDREALLAFQRKVSKLERAIYSADEVIEAAIDEMKKVKQVAMNRVAGSKELYEKAQTIQIQLQDMNLLLNGNRLITAKMELIPPSISARVRRITGEFWSSTSDATITHKRNYEIAAEEFSDLLSSLNTLVKDHIQPLEKELEVSGLPYTPHRRIVIWEDH
ncbi:glycosyl hydrolase [Fulvivirgaceae bacterium BMA10]|uniref:Glycosyl hydrolase n=1 Tax=Splendidivirga corallicola TaxID=3051826 RepID=A0ABT8KSP7_9BACT|nr:glycosyl hydrolase [Fulvivirgaceae bacterium BMA10]